MVKELLAADWILRLNIPESSKLVEMPPKSISGMESGLVSSTHKTTSLDHIVPSVESWSCEVFIYRMDFEILEWVDGR